MKTPRKMIQIALPLLILIGGFAGMQTLVQSKTPPQKASQETTGLLVETLTVTATDRTVQVNATGTVQSSRSASVAPQISGRVIRMAPAFESGGFFRKGALLFEIDPADYELAAEKSRAEVVRAEVELAQVESQARVARLEWDRLRLGVAEKPNPLVLYEPQLKNAQAALAAAKADLAQRQLDIARTRVTAPFNCRVRSKSVALGQFVSAGQSVAEVAGTDAAEIVVPVPLVDLPWLAIPRQDGEPGSQAVVAIEMGAATITWRGQIDRGLGDVDARSRMMRLVVVVEDPYALTREAGDRPAIDLAEGLFVAVTLKGRPLPDVIALPTSALRDDATVWVMDRDHKLEIRPVDLLRREKETALIQSGLAVGEAVVLTQLSGAAEGLQLRLAEENKAAAPAKEVGS